MSWFKPFPGWARIIMAGFGVHILVRTITAALGGSALDRLVPGVVIGGAWAFVGVSGGFPLVATAEGPARVKDGIRTIRRRLRIAYLSLIPWLPLIVVATLHAPKEYETTVFTLVALLPMVPFGFAFLSACPRCAKPFFLTLRYRSPSTLLQCQDCGLRLDHAQDQDAA